MHRSHISLGVLLCNKATVACGITRPHVFVMLCALWRDLHALVVRRLWCVHVLPYGKLSSPRRCSASSPPPPPPPLLLHSLRTRVATVRNRATHPDASRVPCPPTFFALRSTTSCHVVLCSPHWQYALAGADACTLCPAGNFSASVNSTSCGACGVGKFSSPGASSCSGCSAGRFSAVTASPSCTVVFF